MIWHLLFCSLLEQVFQGKIWYILIRMLDSYLSKLVIRHLAVFLAKLMSDGSNDMILVEAL